jgi:hypothetical protein
MLRGCRSADPRIGIRSAAVYAGRSGRSPSSTSRRAAYNRAPASMLGIEDWLAHDADPDGPEPRRQILQRGSGAYSLCAECNNLTGRLYVPELSAWVRSGANALFGEPGG